MAANSLFEVSEQPSDLLSAARFSLSGDKLIVSSWDRNLYVYIRTPDSSTPFTLLKKIEHRAPILDCCFGKDDDTAYTVGIDWDVRRVSLDSGDQVVLSTHDTHAKDGNASNKVRYSQDLDVVISTAWCGTLHVHTADGSYARVQLPQKPYALSITHSRCVVSMAERRVAVYDLRALKATAEQSGAQSGDQVDGEKTVLQVEPWQTRESSLKFMVRDLACMPNGEGYATSSIEGRVGVEFLDAAREKETYAFKCHRQTQHDPTTEQDVEVVYPVNALAFNPVYGTFATGGGDGVVALWDAVSKRRIRQYSRLEASIAALDYSQDGKYLAIAVSPLEEVDAPREEDLDRSRVKVYIRELAEGEAKGKSSKKEAA